MKRPLLTLSAIFFFGGITVLTANVYGGDFTRCFVSSGTCSTYPSADYPLCPTDPLGDECGDFTATYCDGSSGDLPPFYVPAVMRVRG
jgi:hypothetical protein